ncbi:MAG: hypothetical protein JW840_02440 [Candidatus Thermoplasmatota archaeon]|nr:hypothetical protein [Candidatus Thermoplasmatota archaeon]
MSITSLSLIISIIALILSVIGLYFSILAFFINKEANKLIDVLRRRLTQIGEIIIRVQHIVDDFQKKEKK